MHFWIDKRSSYGFGQYQRPGMAGFGYNPRRNRNKTGNQIIPPHSSSSSSGATSTARQNVAPSTSSTNYHGKTTTHHHHHHRGARNNQRTGDSREIGLQDVIIEDSTPNDSMDLNSHHVSIVHSTYPNDDTTTHPTSTRTIGVNQWLPIQIICGLCMILAITLVLLKLYFENYMTGFQVLSLILMSFVFLILTTLLSLLRSRRKRPSLQGTSQLQPTINNHSQSVIIQATMTPTCEPPPPYALALTLPEKQSEIKILTPPPSYEKINII